MIPDATSPTAIIKRWFQEVWNESRSESITALFAEHGIASGLGPQPVQGPVEFRPIYQAFQGAFRDFDFQILKSFEKDDWVSARVEGKLIHTATHKALETVGLVLARVEGGQIVEAHNGFDFVALLEQAGVFPGSTLLAALDGRIFEVPDLRERNKDLVRRLVAEVFNGKQHDRVAEFYSEDCEGFDPALPDKVEGRKGIEGVLDGYEASFMGYRYEIDNLMAEGDQVAFRFTITAVHSGVFKGIGATGKTFTMEGNAILEIQADKVRRFWQHWDNMGFAVELGLIAPVVGLS